MSEELVLYDLPCKGRCQSWSVNVLKTRIALNYKKIPYRTEWVPYVRLQQTLKATGVAPNPEPNWSDYSVPCIRLPDGTHIMDSAKIAPALEKLKSEPSLHLDAKIQDEISQVFGQAIGPLIPYFMPRVARDLCIEEDYEWFLKDRENRFGTSLFEMEKAKGGDVAWEAARPGFAKLKELLTKYKKDEGPFILGSEASYGDFLIVAAAQMFKVLGEEPFEKFVGQEKEVRELYEACKKWTEKDD